MLPKSHVTNMLTDRQLNVRGNIAKDLYQNNLKHGTVTHVFKPDDVLVLETSYPLQIIKLSELSNFHRIKAQGSSKIYNGNIGTITYFIKNVVKSGELRRNTFNVWDLELSLNEVLASVIYTHIYRIHAVRLFLVINDVLGSDLPKYMVASQAILNLKTTRLKVRDIEDIPSITKPFLVDCIMANWDVGQTGNIGIRDDKLAIRVDVGGSLKYRAKGDVRNYVGIPDEHLTFLKNDKKKVSNRLFRNMSKYRREAVYDCIQRVKLDEFDELRDSFETQLRFLKGEEAVQARRVVEVIDITRLRHQYYVKNRSEIMRILEHQ